MTNLEDPLREWAKETARKYRNSKPDCPFLKMAMFFPDSGFPPPKIDILSIGEDGSCQCEHCISARDRMDEALLKLLMKEEK